MIEHQRRVRRKAQAHARNAGKLGQANVGAYEIVFLKEQRHVMDLRVGMGEATSYVGHHFVAALAEFHESGGDCGAYLSVDVNSLGGCIFDKAVPLSFASLQISLSVAASFTWMLNSTLRICFICDEYIRPSCPVSELLDIDVDHKRCEQDQSTDQDLLETVHLDMVQAVVDDT